MMEFWGSQNIIKKRVVALQMSDKTELKPDGIKGMGGDIKWKSSLYYNINRVPLHSSIGPSLPTKPLLSVLPKMVDFQTPACAPVGRFGAVEDGLPSESLLLSYWLQHPSLFLSGLWLHHHPHSTPTQNARQLEGSGFTCLLFSISEQLRWSWTFRWERDAQKELQSSVTQDRAHEHMGCGEKICNGYIEKRHLWICEPSLKLWFAWLVLSSS